MNKLVIVLIAFMASIGPLSTDIYLPGLPEIAHDLGTTASGGQLSLTACFIGLALGQVLVGPWSDEVGRRKPVMVSFIGFGLASFLCGTATSLPLFLLWRFVQGLAGAGCIVLSRSIAGDTHTGHELTRFISLLVLITSIVPIGGPVLGGIILTYAGWEAIFLLLTACGVLGAIWTLAGLPETLPPEARVEGGLKSSVQNMKALWQNESYRGYLLVQGFASMGLFGYIGASPFIMEGMYGFTPTEFSIFFGIGSAALALGAQIFGRLSQSLGEHAILWAGNIAGVVIGLFIAVLACIQPESPWFIMIALVLLIFSCGITLPLSFSSAMNAHKGVSGSASGLLGVISFLAGAVASPLVGIGGGHSMWPLALLIIAEHGASLMSMKIFTERVNAE
ncbi:MAG: multidrug effflux MFS transporter [Veillonella sp.]|uniref:multidrug effflux MFS transporter n=1 Tax=Veillonella sp. TaxID=1926307 RepID=UPI0025EAC405|nr:multidrug effflux MFS transporter [Veillonella sp.]MBS4914311.1 multidrug effflux MFS transporter [Veillonella sp.]